MDIAIQINADPQVIFWGAFFLTVSVIAICACVAQCWRR